MERVGTFRVEEKVKRKKACSKTSPGKYEERIGYLRELDFEMYVVAILAPPRLSGVPMR